MTGMPQEHYGLSASAVKLFSGSASGLTVKMGAFLYNNRNAFYIYVVGIWRTLLSRVTGG